MMPMVLGLCGSLREPSYTRMAMQRVLDATAQRGAQRELAHGDPLRLPWCDGRPTEEYPPIVHQFRQRASEADALVIGSPQYCDTYSAVIKNAIELLGADVFGGKVVGIVTVAEGSSAMGAFQALQSLCFSLNAWVIPITAAVPAAARVFENPESPFAQQVLAHVDALGAAIPETITRLQRRRP